jgi:hypothetical protein
MEIIRYIIACQSCPCVFIPGTVFRYLLGPTLGLVGGRCIVLRYVWRSNLNDIPFVRSSAIIYLSIYPSEPKPNYPVQYVSPSFLGMLFIFFFFFSFSSFLDTSSSDRWFVQSNHVIIWRPQGRHFAMGRILNRSIQMTAQLHTFGNRRIHILDFKVE